MLSDQGKRSDAARNAPEGLSIGKTSLRLTTNQMQTGRARLAPQSSLRSWGSGVTIQSAWRRAASPSFTRKVLDGKFSRGRARARDLRIRAWSHAPSVHFSGLVWLTYKRCHSVSSGQPLHARLSAPLEQCLLRQSQQRRASLLTQCQQIRASLLTPHQRHFSIGGTRWSPDDSAVPRRSR